MPSPSSVPAVRSLKPLTIFLLLACTVLPCSRAKSILNPGALYGSQQGAQNCLNAMWASAVNVLPAIGGSIPNCLRMAFHDAGTYTTASDQGGANGSILRELLAPQNAGLYICPGVIGIITAQVRLTPGCLHASVADIIQVTGSVAVWLAGGPACQMMLGRPDLALGLDNSANLPSPCQTVSSLLTTFTNAGYANPTSALVVLSGAHSIGNSRATIPCGRGLGPMTPNPTSFDNHYYRLLTATVYKPNSALGGPGWFYSDNQLLVGGNPTTASLVRTYASSYDQFMNDWCPHYQEMSMLGVDPSNNYGWMLPSAMPYLPYWF